MPHINYAVKGNLGFDGSGRPTVPLTLAQVKNGLTNKNRIEDMLIDTGAVLTSLNKKVADINRLPIIKHREPVLMGFNDFGRAIRSLIKRGKSDAEAKAYLGQFVGRSKNLIDSLRNEFDITDIGLVCDLRKVSYAVLYDYVIEDVIIVTPSDDDVIITEVIGMNILEKFRVGFDFENDKIHLDECGGTNSRISHDFACGNVTRIER